MARGYIYEITDQPLMYPIRYMHEDDLYDLQNHEFEFTQDLPLKDENPYEVSGIIETLKQYGIILQKTTNPDDKDDICMCFTPTLENKHAYFATNLQSLKNKVKDMTIEEFIEHDYDLKCLIDHPYSDAVYTNNTFCTFDSFMRSIEAGKTYFIGNIAIMH